MTREIKETEDTFLQQILYTGKRSSPEEPGEVFFFYERPTGDEDKPKELMYAVLNLDPDRTNKSRLV